LVNLNRLIFLIYFYSFFRLAFAEEIVLHYPLPKNKESPDKSGLSLFI